MIRRSKIKILKYKMYGRDIQIIDNTTKLVKDSKKWQR